MHKTPQFEKLNIPKAFLHCFCSFVCHCTLSERHVTSKSANGARHSGCSVSPVSFDSVPLSHSSRGTSFPTKKVVLCGTFFFYILLLHEMKLTQHAVTYSAGWNSAFPVRFLLAPPLKCNISSKNILGSPEPVCCTQTWLYKTSLELQGKHLKTHSNKHCVYGVLNMF